MTTTRIITNQPPAPEGAPRPMPYIERVIRDTVGRAGAAVGVAWVGTIAALAVFAPLLASSFPFLIKQADGSIRSPWLSHLGSADVVLFIAAATFGILLAIRRLTWPQRWTILAWVIAVSIPLSSWALVRRRWPGWWEELGPGLTLGIAAAAGLALLAAIVLLPWVSNLSRRAKLFVLLAVLPLAGLLIAAPVAPPRAVVYEQYRLMAEQGELDWALWAPVPFSPTDRLRDHRELRHPIEPTWAPALRGETPQPSAAGVDADQLPWYRHLLGTDRTGADIMSKMIHASRIAIAVGFIATGIALVIGVSIGGVMGYFSGIVDLLGMRLVEIVSAIPTFFLLLAFVAFFPRNLYIMMVIIGVTGWVGYARFVRAEFLKLRQQDFVQAARACGIPLRSILFRHMLPNGVAPVLVEASFGVAAAILYESTLSFLGLGLVDEPSWGQMLHQAAGSAGGFTWWLATFPGLAIFLTVFAFNLVGEALRDAIDPHTKRESA